METGLRREELIHTDVLVIGAGPAGTSAARVAANAGLSVLIVDKKKVIGEPVQCAEFIPAALGSYATSTGVKVQSIADMVSQFNFNQTETHSSRGIMINRAQFDQALAHRARHAGADINAGCSLVKLNTQKKLASVITSNGSANISFKLLIAADGPKSRVARLLLLPPLETINTRQYTVTLQQQSTSTKVWLSSRFPGGYAWLFPRGELANLGVGYYPYQDVSLKSQLEKLFRAQQSAGVVGSEIVSRTGGSIPVSGIREPLTHSCVIFAGDAAGLTHPVSGAGIAAAVVSGELAGESVVSLIKKNNKSALNDYKESVLDLYAESQERAVKKKIEQKIYWSQRGNIPSDVLKQTWIF